MSDIHNYKRRLEIAVKNLNSLSPGNRQIIEGFQKHCFSTGLSTPRIVKYTYGLKTLASLMRKELVEADKGDIESVLAEIEKSSYKPSTKRDFKILVKKFYRWLNRGEIVSWIKTGSKVNQSMRPEQMPTQQDVLKMVSACDNPRDKAFIITLYESGARIGEIGNLEVKDVEFYENYTALRLNGKTGPRRVIAVLATPYLQTWIKHHPLKEGPLWVKQGTTRKIEYQALAKILKNAAKKAGVKKKVNPHNFRHAIATELAKELTEFQLSKYLGWVPHTKMASTYVHLAGRDLDQAILNIYGLTEKKAEKEAAKPRACPRCEVINTLDAKYCQRCGLLLDVKEAMAKDEAARRMERMIPVFTKILKQILEKHPEATREIAAELQALQELYESEV